MLGELQSLLPTNQQLDEQKIETVAEIDLASFISELNVPEDIEFIALHNETLTSEDYWSQIRLADNDEVVLFTPIKGG